jgi:glycosyltransferase involved in cell wall biosynthesis
MKIGINALGLKPGTSGGIESYLYNLLEGLADSDRKHTYYIFVSYPELRSNIRAVRNPLVKVIYVSRTLVALTFALKKPLSALKLVFATVKYGLKPGNGVKPDLSGVYGNVVNFDRYGLDVIHFPFDNLDSSFFGLRTGIALTVHDIQHEYYPAYFEPDELERRCRATRVGEERADVLLAISGATKKSLVERFGTAPEKIVVTYQGCASAFRKISDRGFLDSVKKKYSLPDRFLFYPAGTWTHKNHVRLLEALAILQRKHGFDGELLLTGIPQNNHENVLDAIRRLDLEGKVRFLGYVPFADMPALYNLASLLVFPSLFEGFGIPLVEAMSVGLPVVCSDRTSIPEVAGEAGLYFDPEDVEDMAEKIYRLWSDAGLRNDLARRGLERAKLFTWEQTARKTVSAYELAFEKKNVSGS